jgi:hypothetical protein
MQLTLLIFKKIVDNPIGMAEIKIARPKSPVNVYTIRNKKDKTVNEI